MVKLFITGATGYIGGDGLYAVATAHPEYEITALVRNSTKGAQVAKVYPKVKLVYGDLDSFDVIAQESAKADIVLNFANCDHEGAAKAIVKGLSSRSEPGYIIHTSGTGILTVQDVLANRYGKEDPKIYDDWDGIGEVISLPDSAWHRNVDKIILAASKAHPNIKTAIVCPPTIYGPGRGPGNTFSDQWYLMCKAFIQRGHAFTIGEGKNIWTKVHVHDLSNLYLTLTEEAATKGARATWNDEGYYFAEDGEYVWGDMCKRIAQEAKKQGYIESDDLQTFTIEQGDEVTPNGGKKWGYNSRCKAIRARKLFDWKPVGESIESLLPRLVEEEAQKLGVAKTHAQRAAGAV
ncbi:uncharacterized protein PV09_00484 [Verruconis gallopava]|uniref:NAD-dependent epimerase/dehydratase domain-containing protein n=1 Tax=Verruconis gallopava TaxID=253628 RepID=A0A0D1Z9H2_9PEZI|nr:uncharacterized protein PV09_00484 [Verruconis gallopava]KIW09617.1 hypothetical protein PV09_00484 [Verruconis gallopava]